MSRNRYTSRKSGGSASIASSSNCFIWLRASLPFGSKTTSGNFRGLLLPASIAAATATTLRAPSTASRRVLQSAPATRERPPIPVAGRDAGRPSAEPQPAHLPRLRDCHRRAASADRLRPCAAWLACQNRGLGFSSVPCLHSVTASLRRDVTRLTQQPWKFLPCDSVFCNGSDRSTAFSRGFPP